MNEVNEGFNSIQINELKSKIEKSNISFIINESDDNNEEYVNFFFIGKFQETEVIYDAVIYTLRLHHSSELYEIAERKTVQRYPEYKKFIYQEDDNVDLSKLNSMEEEIGLYMAEVIMELEDEEVVKVQEHLEIDPDVDFGVGLDVGLNVDAVTEEVIENFIKDFNEGNLKLDKTLYSFQTQENDDDMDD
ncbi:MAG: hypothetical protein M3421_06820 [Bacteroidota bacterium]|jgi:hypothetical protein|nr:hypothetical protein [Bacteroidota bacterium]